MRIEGGGGQIGEDLYPTAKAGVQLCCGGPSWAGTMAACGAIAAHTLELALSGVHGGGPLFECIVLFPSLVAEIVPAKPPVATFPVTAHCPLLD